jgi:predicted RNA-binding Zn-ribbon protein involved in translation (DUF1610 family)
MDFPTKAVTLGAYLREAQVEAAAHRECRMVPEWECNEDHVAWQQMFDLLTTMLAQFGRVLEVHPALDGNRATTRYTCPDCGTPDVRMRLNPPGSDRYECLSCHWWAAVMDPGPYDREQIARLKAANPQYEGW